MPIEAKLSNLCALNSFDLLFLFQKLQNEAKKKQTKAMLNDLEQCVCIRFGSCYNKEHFDCSIS